MQQLIIQDRPESYLRGRVRPDEERPPVHEEDQRHKAAKSAMVGHQCSRGSRSPELNFRTWPAEPPPERAVACRAKYTQLRLGGNLDLSGKGAKMSRQGSSLVLSGSVPSALCLIILLGLDPVGLGGELAAEKQRPASAWQPLFDGRTLEGWKSTRFGGEGEVWVEGGAIRLDFGSSLTGVTYQAAFPKMDYEICLQAMRVDGIDFFCGLTFPVDESHCSLIVGGWAGAVVGLSSIDGRDASENETTRFMAFETGRWYRIRLRVRPQRIEAWIDDQQVVDQSLAGHRVSTRTEVDLSRPLGISAWETRAALRRIRFRRLDP